MKKMLEGLRFETVLDAGCGEGSNLNFIRILNGGAELTGCDVSERALVLAREKAPFAEFYLFDCEKEKLEKSFDLVISSDVMEHLENDVAAIQNLYDMTARYCLIGTISGRMRDFEADIGHKRNYAIGELEEKMGRAGFKVLKRIYWGWPFYSPLYRNFLNLGGINQLAEGKMGLLKKIAAIVLFIIFFLNSSQRGDSVFVLAEKR